MRLKILFITILIGFMRMPISAQLSNSDNKFQRPLADVLTDIEREYSVTLRISDKNLEGKVLTYANWRFRPTVEETLKNVLAPFDLMALPDGAPNKYKIEEFRYHRRTVEEGKETLDYLASKYQNKAAWEIRQKELKQCLKEAIRLNPMPVNPGTKPILGKKRKMNGYSVQNIGLEVLPGFYVCGSIYRPAKSKGKIPVILCPNGHFGDGRYNKDVQTRCAGLALMGAMAVNYDLFAWGESALQVDSKSHRKALANTIQALNSIRLLDYLLSLKNADPERVGITGGSGGGSHTMLISAIDRRIQVSVPTVMMSAIHYGGCPCESGNPIHLCGGGTNNVEIAALFAPKPQLIISDGGDWTANVPELEFPYVKRVYDFYDNGVVENTHFPNEGHDYGPSKRKAMYLFMAKMLDLNINTILTKQNDLDESAITIESANTMKVFGENGEQLPANSIQSFEQLEMEFERQIIE